MHKGERIASRLTHQRPNIGYAQREFVLVAILALLTIGCALTQEVTKTPRNAVEQLLLSQAVEVAWEGVTVPIPEGESIRVEVTGLQADRAHLHMDEQDQRMGVIDSPSWDLAFVRDLVAGRLGALGYRVRRSGEEATYLVGIMVHAIVGRVNEGKAQRVIGSGNH